MRTHTPSQFRPHRRIVSMMLLLAGLCTPHAVLAGPLVTSVFERMNAARQQDGLKLLGRQALLDSAAVRRAGELAALPRRTRLASRRDIGEVLKQAGVRQMRRATEYIQVERGDADPAAAVMERWRADPDGEKLLLDPAWTAVGLATRRAPDGAIVLAVIFFEPLDLAADVGRLERRIEAAINSERRQHGLLDLVHDDRLAAVARGHSQDMARRHYFGHEDPEGRGPADRVRANHIVYRKLAENVAENQGMDDPADTAVRGWLKSPGHRANIFDRDVTRSGVGVALDPDAGMYTFTQLFLQPPRGR